MGLDQLGVLTGFRVSSGSLDNRNVSPSLDRHRGMGWEWSRVSGQGLSPVVEKR